MNLYNLMFIIIIILFFNAYKIETGKIQPNFDEIFGEKWDKNENEKQLIKIEQNEKTEVEQMGGENGTHPNDQQKRKTIQKFDAIKEKLRDKGKYKNKKQTIIEIKIAKLLGTNLDKIYKWKKEFNLNKKMEKSFYMYKKKEFIERLDEFKCLYGQGKQKEFVKELGISNDTFRRWKKELVPNYHKKNHTNEEKLRKMKKYYEIKQENPKINDKIIAKKFGIGSETLRRWKREFTLI